MSRPPKPPPQFRLQIEYMPASEEDAKFAISALALMYRHVMLRRGSTLSVVRHAEALPATQQP